MRLLSPSQVPGNSLFTEAFFDWGARGCPLCPEATSFFDVFVLIYNNYVLHNVKGKFPKPSSRFGG